MVGVGGLAGLAGRQGRDHFFSFSSCFFHFCCFGFQVLIFSIVLVFFHFFYCVSFFSFVSVLSFFLSFFSCVSALSFFLSLAGLGWGPAGVGWTGCDFLLGTPCSLQLAPVC